MHLRSVTMKGFKSFPDRTKLEFSSGVSVVVGPNGSGKSNITDAVLWALGEQSPLAVRGQTMQDVIFAGGSGLKPRKSAEVEVVIDNGDGALGTEFSELSIVRRLHRSGEGEYRLNGARCRLVDVIEALSDTGLGKEMHSVVSQGRVEAIVHSRPRDRRLLIEEAAGLGKHRKRRRRAQLKLERTQENLSRALDVEREARSRLRPLKRQAEAAELHERLERQSLEAEVELAADDARARHAELADAESRAAAARGEAEEAEGSLAEVAQRREAVEEAFAQHSREREALSSDLFSARSAVERAELHLSRARETGSSAEDELDAARGELERLEALAGAGAPAGEARVAALQSELEGLDAQREDELSAVIGPLEDERATAAARLEELERTTSELRSALEAAERAVEAARAQRSAAEADLETARGESAALAAELAAADRLLAALPARGALGDQLGVEPGYERALAAVLGPLFGASVVTTLDEGQALLDRLGDDGGSALLASGGGDTATPEPPLPGAERILDRLRPAATVAPAAARLLADVWVVDSLDAVPGDFRGVAVTRAGRVLAAATGELRQAPAGGEERALEARNRRDRLAERAEAAGRVEAEARRALERAGADLGSETSRRETAEGALRDALRMSDEASESVRRSEWLIERRREAPQDGPVAVRRAELAAELRAERRLAEQAERERAERGRRAAALRTRIDRLEQVRLESAAAADALDDARAAAATRRAALERRLAADEAVGERAAAELRECARAEAELQRRLKQATEAVTAAEVGAQQSRDVAAEIDAELGRLAGRLGVEPEAATEALPDDRREELRARIERLARRRESLGPVNPLAKAEYEEAVAHVEELEGQREDLEGALSELEGLIRETDRRIRESFEQTFDAAARNFEEVVQHLFPGGKGRLSLVQPEAPRPVIGGEPTPEPRDADGGELSEPDPDEAPAADEPGVEVEVTPAGKSTRRLSLLSGGEKSLVALAFMFAVFLARPCPFYILDEVEAALDDPNIDRFLQLVRRYSDRAQFVIVTHQKRTMDAADCLYGVSMGSDGVSRVASRRFGGDEGRLAAVSEAA